MCMTDDLLLFEKVKSKTIKRKKIIMTLLCKIGMENAVIKELLLCSNTLTKIEQVLFIQHDG